MDSIPKCFARFDRHVLPVRDPDVELAINPPPYEHDTGSDEATKGLVDPYLAEQLKIPEQQRHRGCDRVLAQDNVELPSNLHPYAHGAGFGIATEILGDPYLAAELEKSELQRYEECEQILAQHKWILNAASAKKITLCLENSPVLAAAARFKLGMHTLEWDIWLDQENPESLDKAVIKHGSILATLFGKYAFMRNYFVKSAPSVTEWVRIYKKTARELYSADVEIPPICLDIKSDWSTAQQIDSFIQALRREHNIEVRFVGSFLERQIAQVSEAPTILFCHAVRDLQQKVNSGGSVQTVMLNGADLEDPRNLATLRVIAKAKNLKIGIYVQEPEADTKAIQNLIHMVNNESELFSLGFALGNSRDGRAPYMIRGSGAGVQKLLMTNSILFKIRGIFLLLILIAAVSFPAHYLYKRAKTRV